MKFQIECMTYDLSELLKNESSEVPRLMDADSDQEQSLALIENATGDAAKALGRSVSSVPVEPIADVYLTVAAAETVTELVSTPPKRPRLITAGTRPYPG